MIDSDGVFTEEFTENLPTMLGDDFYNDPDTKQQPTKIFDNIKDLPTVLKKVVNAERTISKHGQELEDAVKGKVAIPGENGTPEEIAAFNKAMGVPETTEGYKLNIPQDVSDDDKAVFGKISDAIIPAALEAGVPPAKLAGVWDKVVDTINSYTKDIEAKGAAIMAQEQAKLKEELGDKYDNFIAESDKVYGKTKTGMELKSILTTYGLNEHPAVRKHLAEIAPLVNQGATVVGDSASGSKDETQLGNTTYEYDENGKPIPPKN